MDAKVTREAVMREAEKRGLLPDRQAILDEARRRGLGAAPLPQAEPLYDIPMPASLSGGVVDGMARGLEDLLDSSAQLMAPTLEAVAPSGGVLHGMARGVRDPWDTGKQLAAHTLEAVAPSGSGFEKWAQSHRQNTDREVNAGLDRYRQARQKAGKGDDFDWGRYLLNPWNFVGGVGLAAKIPQATGYLGRIGAGLAGGGLFNAAATPVESGKDFWAEKAHQAKVGAVLGGALPAVTHPVSGLLRMRLPADAKRLIDQGVYPPVGGLLGDHAKRVEDILRSMPGGGNFIKNAYLEATDEFNEAAVNQVLGKVGERMVREAPGHAQIEALENRLSERYEALMPHLHGRLDWPFQQALMAIQQKAGRELPPDELKLFNNFLEHDVLWRFGEHGGIGGHKLKEVDTALGQQSMKDIKAANQQNKNNKGELLRDVRDAFHEMLARYSPEHAAELKTLNEAWTHYKILEEAAKKASQNGGVFTPRRLLTASKKKDTSKDQRATAQGRARFQKYGQAGERYLGNVEPNSGTAERMLLNQDWLTQGAATVNGLLFGWPYLTGVRQGMAKRLAKKLGEDSPETAAMAKLFQQLGLGGVPMGVSGVTGTWE
ncbi:MAG: hypothetical protein AB2565_13450 [Candidatus Thiodiazotropha endolucinida]|uniref:Uncharacterized protein n=1 Tax=Candidatus Thiodiazotropha endolucinida TaxID=1655433 RepID=A0A7Z0VNK9_9GAMM|nr:hypothetical protein [Candidatus Thiodiazotropha endolucinida]ODJ88486.1 hypothetical protein CODIS_10320 [Candidatus Thiodiazotropha endolucinida]